MNPKPLLATSLALGFFMTGCGQPPTATSSAPPPVEAVLPDFALVGDDGAPLTSETLAGRPWVASFLFTSCGSVCPAMVGRIQVLQHGLPEGVPIVSISVDPEHDTPEVLAEFAAFNQRLPGRWLLATGPWEVISQVASEGFGLAGHQRGLHSPNFGLVDAEGRLRGRYDSRDGEAMAAMVRDLALLPRAAQPEVKS